MVSQANQNTYDFKLLNELRKYDLMHISRTKRYLPEGSEERSHLTRLLLSANEEFDQYDIMIGRLRNHLVELEGEREELKVRVRCSQSVLSSRIRKLPREILLEIFAHTYTTDIMLRGQKATIPFLRASSTCAYWRDIVHSTKSLWSSLAIYGTGYQALENNQAAVNWILNMSGDLPLSIRFGFLHDGKPNGQALGVVFQSSSRWKSLDMMGCNRKAIFNFVIRAMQSSELPRLETLKLSMEFMNVRSPLDIFNGIPLLTKLSLHLPLCVDLLVKYGHEEHIRQLPWKQLQSIDLCTRNIFQFGQIVSHCDNLLSLRFQSYFEPRFGQDQTVSGLKCIKKLKELSIKLDNTCADPSALSQVFKFLVLPSLSRMKINVIEQVIDFLPILPEFQVMISRSMCLLSELTIKAIDSHINNALPLLSQLPSLKSLTLTETSYLIDTPSLISSKLIAKLGESVTRLPLADDYGAQDSFLPELESLCLETQNIIDLDQNGLLKTVRSRFKGSRTELECLTFDEDNGTDIAKMENMNHAALKHVRFTLMTSSEYTSYSHLNDEMLKEYRYLQLEGLNIRIIIGDKCVI